MLTRFLAVAALGLFAGCYDPPGKPCTITCSETSGCPGDQLCIDGLCRGEGDVCTYPPLEWRQVSVGATFACGITTEDQLFCWGNNRRGQLGSGAGVDEVAAPKRVGSATWTEVSAGAEHACGIRDGKVMCWGYNGDGQVRGEKGSEFPEPQPVVIALGSQAPAFEHVSAGSRHTCAIGEGQLWCWGNMNQVGVANVAATKIGTLTDWTAVAAGYDHTCAISKTAGLHCWGENSVGQVDATLVPVPAPTPIDIGGLAAIAVAAGDQLTCAIVAASSDATVGELWCWGRNNDYQIDMSGLNTGTPTRIGTEGTWSQIATGASLVCGVRDGFARCWGRSDIGSIGGGIWASRIPEAMAQPILAADTLAIGKRGFAASVNDTRTFLDFACARSGKKLYCWGDNEMGTLASGVPSTRRLPVQVMPPTGATWTKLYGGLEHACGLTSANELHCWGGDYDAQISAGIPRGVTQPCVADQPCDYPKPTRAPASATRFDDVVLGREFTCVRETEIIKCWGRANLGATPTGGIALPRAPQSSVWSKMWGGWYGTCGLTAVGGFACWGNVAGTNTSAPTNQTGAALTEIDDVSVGENNICAHRMDNTRVCWGINGEGQVGDGTQIGVATPTAYNIGTIADLELRSRHACAVNTDGTVSCWGSNQFTQTGSNATTPTLSPTLVISPVGNLSGCTRVTTGLRHSCAVCNETVECWGEDDDGALGRYDTSSTSSRIARPIDLPDVKFTDVVARGIGTCGLTVDGKVYCWGTGRYGGNGDGGQARNIPTEIVPR